MILFNSLLFLVILVFFVFIVSMIILYIVFFPLKSDFKNLFRQNGYNYNYYDGKENLRYKRFNSFIEFCCKKISYYKPLEVNRFLKSWRFFRKLFIILFVMTILALCTLFVLLMLFPQWQFVGTGHKTYPEAGAKATITFTADKKIPGLYFYSIDDGNWNSVMYSLYRN